MRRSRDAVRANVERLFAEGAFDEAVGLPPKQIVGGVFERLAGAVFRQRAPQWSRSAERRIDGEQDVLGG